MKISTVLGAACAALFTATAPAATLYGDAAAFTATTGATSFSGPLPVTGNVQGSMTLGSVTVTAPLWLTLDWSTLLPGREIAIAYGMGDVGGSYNEGVDFGFAAPMAAAGFFFHEPTLSSGAIDGCNTTCVNSTFRITLLNAGGTAVGSFDWNPPKNTAAFWGVSSPQPFVKMQVREIVGSDDNEFYGQIYAAPAAAVPEPASAALATAGLLTLALRRRATRHRRA